MALSRVQTEVDEGSMLSPKVLVPFLWVPAIRHAYYLEQLLVSKKATKPPTKPNATTEPNTLNPKHPS